MMNCLVAKIRLFINGQHVENGCLFGQWLRLKLQVSGVLSSFLGVYI